MVRQSYLHHNDNAGSHTKNIVIFNAIALDLALSGKQLLLGRDVSRLHHQAEEEEAG